MLVVKVFCPLSFLMLLDDDDEDHRSHKTGNTLLQISSIVKQMEERRVSTYTTPRTMGRVLELTEDF